ncbi:GNAT family N-acetyltransferase [Chromobacterium sphagni]|uniref:GNAT family N-acetyltransferase n=1 Tax=Chromobacterium sphagni TaxID=1903179 RepID=UPI0009F2C0E9|nr:GNAT family N-acetyltransferase [Chromobacterium sphagni]
MRVADLARLSSADLHPCFLEAFSDYLVPAQPDLEQLRRMLLRRGWVPELSAGAWQGGRLVGFWLCATPEIAGRVEGYCIAAGVSPIARRHGALSGMAAKVSQLLAKRGIFQQRLEVMEDNQRARPAYAKLGFQPARQLDCYQIQMPIAGSRYWPVTTHAGYLPAQWPQTDWLAYPPAVPNRRDSLLRADPAPRWLSVRSGDVLQGSLLLSADGEVLELMVAPGCRRQGIASQLLHAGQSLSPGGRLTFNNVDRRDLAMISLLLRHQAVYRLSQWEMLKPAGP